MDKPLSNRIALVTGASRGNRGAGEDRGVQRLDALRAFPTPPAAATAGKSEEGSKARPLARKDRAGTHAQG